MIYFNQAKQNFPVKKIWNLSEHSIFMTDTLLEMPSQYFDVKATIVFPKETCCPVVQLYGRNTFINLTHINGCYKKPSTRTALHGEMFILDPRRPHPNNVQCSEDRDKYMCSFNATVRDLNPNLQE